MTKPLKNAATPPYLWTAFLPNEGILMVEALERRSWWKKLEKESIAQKYIEQVTQSLAETRGACWAAQGDGFNFWWGPNGNRFSWKLLQRGKRQLVNRLEDHKEICTKTRLAL
eukprot:1182449-Prorocentrum_minimum.AAC.4